jgi:hypothetical protein
METAYVRSARFDNKRHARPSVQLISYTPPTTPRHESIDPCEHRQFNMVATRRGAQKAPEVAPAPSNTLNAPPKRGGRKKATVEAAVTEPMPVATKPTKTTATKRKAKSEPEAAELPAAKKPAMNTKATRAAKVETKAEPAPAAPKRATRGKKAAEPEVTPVEEPVAVEEAPKPTTTRGRKAAVKKAPAPKIEEPVTVEEPATVEEPSVEEAPKPTLRGRKAPAPKTAVTKVVKAAVVQKPIIVEPVKPAPRARKAAVPKPSLPPPAAVSRPTRGRNAAAPPPESPLKAPARKPAKKAAAIVAKDEPAPMEDVFSEFPGYPATPAHIVAPLTSRKAMAELPNYPNTPAHIVAPISSKDALAELPEYPKTPAHIVAPINVKTALAELPDYPKTPAHIKAPISIQAAMAELPGYPKTPAHITAPVLPMAIENEEVRDDLSEYVNTPVHVEATSTDDNALAELPDYPTTPAHIQAPIGSKEALNELPGYPKTPAHIQAPLSARKALAELPVDYPKTPAHIQAPLSARKALAELPVDYPKTPAHIVVATPSTIGLDDLPADCFATPAHVSSPVVAEEGAAEEYDGPRTPQQLVWGVTNQEAFDELPEYPKTPEHIAAPVSNKEALAELPSYPATPALELEAAIQEEITASVKKQTPSPLHFASLNAVSAGFTEASEVTETSEITDCDPMDVDTEVPLAQPMPKLQFASIQLSASHSTFEVASPKKSALRSPQKFEAKTPKKAVTWEDKEESELSLCDGPFQGMTFFVDVTSNGREHNYVFISLLEDLGAKVAREWSSTGVSHVLFKDGSIETLKKVAATKGAVKCVNVGWVLDCESSKTRVDETPYLVDLSIAIPSSPAPTVILNPRTPARTPSKYALPPSSECRSIPTTPTSSEFDRSINMDDDKENSDVGLFFQDVLGIKSQAPRTCPPKKSVLLSRSPMKTPSKLNFLSHTPAKPFSTTKKRSFESSSLGLSLSAPPKKLRLF